jgi:hypothetical protein
MRLDHCDHSFLRRLACGRQDCPDLNRVMRIIVDDGRPADFAGSRS